eukprot:CAMPEP_0198732698 /NCGR_PEP_ID=MMETSP1475-20131203/38235_1 /TAXON_ID= ORGANISM="Unidentified sp., Strain CCMP1999" /NCGR_SAMPLE_ID=MMETSP1475 /ASSEMBLY_ACC=CAM_ASM_001111 /LENGTH=322 /DNA_ID=CAMNT_0044495849 /DNA_START=77 /DNA_END=1045 /DNA_ORIENTATION=+
MEISQNDVPRWELSKENVQPRARGRDPELLEKALQTGPLLTGKLGPIPDVQQSEDPVQVLYGHVLQLEEENPTSSHALVPVLEAVTKQLAALVEYRNDERHLRLWLTYADLLRDPTTAYGFMQANDIGTELPLFYEAWSTVMEERGRYEEASELYQIGRSRFPDCVSLATRETYYQLRMAERLTNAPEEVEDRRPDPRPRRGPRPGVKASAASFRVFADENAPDSSSAVARNVSRGNFKTLAPDRALRKENAMQPARWNESRLGGAGPAVQRRPATRAYLSAGTVDVYVDESPQPAEPRTSSARLQARRQFGEVHKVNRFLR